MIYAVMNQPGGLGANLSCDIRSYLDMNELHKYHLPVPSGCTIYVWEKDPRITDPKLEYHTFIKEDTADYFIKNIDASVEVVDRHKFNKGYDIGVTHGRERCIDILQSEIPDEFKRMHVMATVLKSIGVLDGDN